MAHHANVDKIYLGTIESLYERPDGITVTLARHKPTPMLSSRWDVICWRDANPIRMQIRLQTKTGEAAAKTLFAQFCAAADVEDRMEVCGV